MKDRKSLPKRAAQIYEFIRNTIHEQNFSPSIREICDAIGLSSPANVHRHLETLETRGYITRANNSSRTIRLADVYRGLLLAGVVPAGRPIEAFEQEERLDLGGLYDSDEYFGLRVQGESMIEACIQDGDIVVIKKQNTCQNGQIVSALIDGSEVTLKRYYKRRGKISLEPANSSMEPIYPKDITIQGIAVGVIRTDI